MESSTAHVIEDIVNATLPTLCHRDMLFITIVYHSLRQAISFNSLVIESSTAHVIEDVLFIVNAASTSIMS